VEIFFSPEALTPLFSTAAALLVWLTAGLLFYGWLFDRAVFEGQGRVRAENFGWTDAVIGMGLIGLFVLLMAAGFRADSGQPKPTPSEAEIVLAVVVNTVILSIIIFGILVSLTVRQLSWRETFGLTRLGPARVMSWAALALVMAFPLVMGVMLFTQWLLGPGKGSDPQEMVRFLAESKSSPAKWALAVSAVVCAPIQEEFIFRGYIYPMLRRYLGTTLGIVLSAALFAGIHTHVSVLGGLFVLAACLTLAYEWTGCIFVPMAMHALFNSLTVINLLTGGKP
jgi:membrane protease YdiL (CAAX protease family)